MSFRSGDIPNPLWRRLFRSSAPLGSTTLSSRELAFDVHGIKARPDVPSAVYAFAHRYGDGWWVHYVGAARDGLSARLAGHPRLGAAIGLGATHLLVRATPAHLVFVDEGRLVAELAPPLNEPNLRTSYA